MPDIDRRREQDDLPTKLELSFLEMDADDQNRLQYIGAGMIVLGFAVPLVGGLFVELGNVYLGFCALGIAVGFLLVWPRGGIAFAEWLLRMATKVVPSAKLKELVQPVERRGEEDDR